MGERHSSTAQTYNNMGSVFRAQGKDAEALEYCGKSLAIRREVLGERHPPPSRPTTTWAMSSAHAEALECYQKSLAIRREVTGRAILSFGNTCNNMAALHHNQGDSDRARELFAAAHAAYLASYGPDHSRTRYAAEQPDGLVAAFVTFCRKRRITISQ